MKPPPPSFAAFFTASRILALAALLHLLLPIAATAAPLAALEGGQDAEGLLRILLGVVLALLACVAIGATVLLMRIVLPSLAAAADVSLARLGTRRLILSGLLPLIGAGLLAQGVDRSGVDALGVAFFLLVGLPMALATLVGVMAALPHVGRAALRAGAGAPLTHAAVGGIVLGLSMVTWVVRPLGVLVSLLLVSWCLGAGLGVFLWRGPRASSGQPTVEPGVELGVEPEETPVG